jgi:hypothetical protein
MSTTSSTSTSASTSTSETAPSTTGRLLRTWEAFAAACREATGADIEEFRAAVTKEQYDSAYPTVATVVLSFRSGTAEQIVAGIDRLLKSHKGESGMSDTRRTSIERLAQAIVAYRAPIRKEQTRLIASPKQFSDFVDFALNSNQANRVHSVKEVVQLRAESGEIEWCTPDGKPIIDKADYGNWKESKPTQATRSMWHCRAVALLPAPARLPTQEDLPVYCRSVDGKTWMRSWIQSKKTSVDRAKLRVDSPVRQDEFDSAMLRSDGYKAAIAEAEFGTNVRTRGSIYLLLMIDDDAPTEWRWQAYIGKANPGVKSRWFSGRKSSSHLAQINMILRDAKEHRACTGQLVEVALAHAWKKHGTWQHRAWLFVLSNGIPEVDLGPTETALIERYRTKDPLIGMNLKS